MNPGFSGMMQPCSGGMQPHAARQNTNARSHGSHANHAGGCSMYLYRRYLSLKGAPIDGYFEA